MYKKAFLILCSIILLGAVVSCGGGGEDPPYGPGNLTFYNNTSLSISALYLTPSAAHTWGSNRLSSPVPSGASYTLTGINPDLYDVKAAIIGEFSTYYGYIYDIPIEAWQTYELDAYNSDFSGSLKIVNATVGAYIDAIYVSPTGSGSWGPNQITSSIAPGNFMHFYDLSSDSYDVKIVWNIGADSFYYSNIISSLTLLTLDVN